jgi:hypothetical protein
VPDDLLRYLDGPSTYSAWWLVLGLFLLIAVIAWVAGVVVWTMPDRLLRRLPVVGSLHDGLVRRRFARSVRAARRAYAAGEMSAAQAAAVIKHALRSFLARRTGRRVHHMHIADLTKGELAPAAPVVAALDDTQFGTASDVELDGVARQTEELIQTWT